MMQRIGNILKVAGTGELKMIKYIISHRAISQHSERRSNWQAR